MPMPSPPPPPAHCHCPPPPSVRRRHHPTTTTTESLQKQEDGDDNNSVGSNSSPILRQSVRRSRVPSSASTLPSSSSLWLLLRAFLPFLLLMVLLFVGCEANGRQPSIYATADNNNIRAIPPRRRAGAVYMLFDVNKKSELSTKPQWEDLGWAWGKKRSPADWRAISAAQKAADTAAAVGPQWDDLGWSWKKKRAERQNADEEEEDQQQPTAEAMNINEGRGGGGRGGVTAKAWKVWTFDNEKRASAAVAAAQQPDWHDLGWAWGR